MELSLTIRDATGAPWFSTYGTEAFNDKLRACLTNVKMTEQAKKLIQQMLGPGVIGVNVIEDTGIVKVVCRRDCVRATIPIERPQRPGTAAALDQLASRLKVAEERPPGPAVVPQSTAPVSYVSAPKLSLEARIRSRANLGPSASPSKVRTRARHNELRGVPLGGVAPPPPSTPEYRCRA